TLFCRATAGVWMSRSSLVWGPFSLVWGLAIAIATALLHKSRNKSDAYIFIVGTVLGGVYEYVCSIFTEIVFGQVFWDYSNIPFNIGGRINLLYCFFWGIAAVVWIKGLYPVFSRLIESIPNKIGKAVTWLLVVFMICNITVSVMALIRYDERANGVEASAGWQQTMDERFGDERMKRIYPNAVSR
ncbi:MAG: putative ABC transporter permease, partial [Clostridia bacterium]|nr:putative ABC transporter permease [Clostridia bacterium]